jgi:enoyl-CoA hydratase/carnithine racemase
MSDAFLPVAGPLATLSALRMEQAGPIVHVQLALPLKRNALNSTRIASTDAASADLPETAGTVVLGGGGEHFSAGLDLPET